MTTRLYPSGHLNDTKPEGPPVCEQCGKRHMQPWVHKGQCSVKGCSEPALKYQGKASSLCRLHSVKDADDPIEPRVQGGAYAEFIEKNKAPAFVALSGELARELGQLPDSMVPELGEIRYVESRSHPGHFYPMAWAPVSGWVHADGSCPAFGECWHRKEAENMTSVAIRGSGQEITERQTLLIEYDAAAISRGVDTAIAAKWAYSLPNRVDGVSVRGVEEGLRLLSSHGEIIRVDECVLVNQDDREAFFLATASRYVIGGDGSEIKLDTQKRGKRVPKWEPKADGSGEYFVKAWYELGVVKASRNAALALMPSNVKTALLKAGLDAAAAEKRGGGNNQPAPQRQAAPRPSSTAARQTVEAPAAEGASPPAGWTPVDAKVCEHQAKVDDEGRTVCSKCGLVLQ